MNTTQAGRSLQEQASKIMEQLYSFVNVYLLNTGLEYCVAARRSSTGAVAVVRS